MSIGNLSITKSFQSRAVRMRRMTNDEQPSSDISTQPNICYVEPSQTTTVAREDDVKDVNDDNIGMEMNKQILLKDLNPTKARLKYN